MKKYYFISLIIVFVLIFISCSKDPTSTSDNCFFTIYVKDTNGNPVEGLNVSIMHQLTIDISDKSLSGFNMSREYSNVNGDENIFAYDRAHPVYVEIYNSSLVHPANGDFTFTAYLTKHPDDILYETTVGCWYDGSNGLISVECGSFDYGDWADGDILHVDGVETSSSETGSKDFTTTLADGMDIFLMPDGLYLSGGGLPVELAAFTATYVVEEYAYISICWTTVSETDVAGFNIYRHTENNFSAADKINTSLLSGQGTTSETHNYTFEDDSFMENTTYYYWLEIQDIYGETSHSTVIEYDPENGGGGFDELFVNTYLANYPNPVTTSTTFSYAINGHKIDANVTINIYNVVGQLVETISASNGEANWNPGNMISGAYYYTLTADDYSKTKLMCYYPEDNIIGTTSNYGIFTTEEKIFFPSLYSLPDMVHTSLDPNDEIDSLGVFNYTDEVEIVISDTDSTNSQSYIETIQDNVNYFEYVWPY